ncbi:hypothetical protein, partial [Escherichia coli]|uniref:hypothetical protein n=1 Tax=Escherichia coli TaxID=562 RepID=UPI0010CB1EB0
QRAKHPLFVTNVDDTRLDDIAAWTYRAPVEEQARIGFAIPHALGHSPTPLDGSEPPRQVKTTAKREAAGRGGKNVMETTVRPANTERGERGKEKEGKQGGVGGGG